MLVLSHSNTRHLNGYMVGCGCHEILIALCYPQEVFCPDQEKSPGNRNFHRDNERNAERWQWNTNWRHKIINPDNWKVRCGYPWILINWIYLCFSLFLCSRTLTLIVVDSSFKIQEFLDEMAISLKSGRVKQNNHSFLAHWPDRALSSQHLRRFSGILSVYLCILPLFHRSTASFGRLSASPDSLHSLTSPHYANRISLPQSKTQLQKAFSLNAGALSLWHSLRQ